MDPWLSDHLKDLSKPVRELETQLRNLKIWRDAGIVQAREAGHTYEAIAAVAGLSFKQVQRICARERETFSG